MKLDTNQHIYSLMIDDAQRQVVNYISIGEGVSSIKAFREEDGALWFAVWAGDEMVKRINGRFVVEVSYFMKEQ